MVYLLLSVVILLLVLLHLQVLGLERVLYRIIHRERHIMATIDEVLEGLAELPTIEEGLDQVFAILQELIAAGKTDPVKLQQALDLITVHKDRVKADIIENTPTP